MIEIELIGTQLDAALAPHCESQGCGTISVDVGSIFTAGQINTVQKELVIDGGKAVGHQRWEVDACFRLLTTCEDIVSLRVKSNCHSHPSLLAEEEATKTDAEKMKSKHLIKYCGTTDLDQHLVTWFQQMGCTPEQARLYPYS